MTVALEALAVTILVSVVIGIYRIERGPTGTDRMLSAMLFGTSGVALTVVLAELTQLDGLRDMGLTFALLGALASVAFVKRAWGADD